MRTIRIRNTRKIEKGQSLIEFALVVPLLLLLVIGIAEFGRAWMTKNILTGAAREGVRMAAVAPPVGFDNVTWMAAITARTDNILNSAGIVADNVVIIIDVADYQPVSVTVSYSFPVVIAGFIPGLNTTILLSSTTTMRREY